MVSYGGVVMENKDLAVAQIVSAIISKNAVRVGADNKDGVIIEIKGPLEIKEDFRGRISLENLIDLVRKSL